MRAHSFLLAAVFAVGCAVAQPAQLVLKFGWAPGFCENLARTGEYCGGSKPFNAFRLNRLHAISDYGTTLGGACTGAAWDPALVPQDLLPELGCVWNSYAEPNNNGALWESLWTEVRESGACTGLTQDVWMRTALRLRDTYNVDTVVSEAGLSYSPVSTELSDLLAKKLGYLPRMQCNATLDPPQLTSISLCFATTAPFSPEDCLYPGTSCAEARLMQPPGALVSQECAPYYPSAAIRPSTVPAPAPSLPPSQQIPAGGGPAETSTSGVPIGAIVGGTVGAVLLVAAALGLCVYVKKRRQRRRDDLGDSLESGPKAFVGTGGGGLGGSGGSGIPAAWGGEPPAGMPALKKAHLAQAPSVLHRMLPKSDGAASLYNTRSSGSHAPSTPALPAGAAWGASLGSFAGPQQYTNQGPLLEYLKSKMVASSVLVSDVSAMTFVSGATQASSHRTPSGVDVQPWELAASEIRLHEQVGTGSFGAVFRATWHETVVAVKVLLLGGSAGGGSAIRSNAEAQRALSIPVHALMKLEEEASLLASLRHPNIVSFFGVCRDPPCIITEFCEQGSLTDVLWSARTDPATAALLTWPRRLAMALDAAKGMLYLHNRSSPIVHRDLKSPNLLVDSHWTVKVSDFNLSRIIEEEAGNLTSSAAVMNPRWLAPEVMQGQHATQAADVYSFGIVLHELLTWELPWAYNLQLNHWQLATMICSGSRPAIPARDELPGADSAAFAGLDAYVALMQRCWAQGAAERPTFPQAVQELRSIQELTSGPSHGASHANRRGSGSWADARGPASG